MIFFNTKCVIFAIVAIIPCESRLSGFVPNNSHVQVGGGKNQIAPSISPETLSFASLFQKSSRENSQNCPRISEENFRLDYIQGVRPPKNAPVNIPLGDEEEDTEDGKVDFIYGYDSTCYRGLTRPTKASLVLALVLLSGMIATSPDIHNVSLQSLSSLLEGSRHLLGDSVATEISTLIERMSFQWDMLGLPEHVHHMSSKLAMSFSDELVPYVSNLRHDIQEAMTTLPDQFDVFLAQVASHIDSMKEEFASQTSSSDVTFNQVLVNAKSTISEQSNEWQVVYHAKTEQVNNQIMQSRHNLLGGINEALHKGKELFEGKLANVHLTSQAKIQELQQNCIQESGKLREQIIENIASFKDTTKLKILEFQHASRMDMEKITTDAHQRTQKIQKLANDYALDGKSRLLQNCDLLQHAIREKSSNLEQKLLTEAMKYQDMVDTVVQHKRSELEQFSILKMEDVGKNILENIGNFQRSLAKVSSDFEMKRRDVDTNLGAISQSLHGKMVSFAETKSIEVDQIKESLAFQSHASMDTVQESLHEWKDSTSNVWSAAKDSTMNQVANIRQQHDSMTTESTFLKTVLNEVVY